MYKTVSYLLLSFFIVQSSCNILVPLDDTTDDVKNTINQVINAVSNATENAINYLAKVVANATSIIANEVSKGTIQVVDEFGQFIDQLNNIKNKAINDTVDISKCLLNSEDKFLNIPVTFVENISGCGVEATKNVIGVFKEVTGILQDIAKRVNDLITSLANCGINPLCIGALVLKAGGSLIELPIIIVDHVIKAVANIVSLQAKGINCVITTVTELPTSAENAIGSISDCVKKI